MNIQDQGIENKRYRLIPRVLIFVFDSGGRVLLLKGAKNKRIWAEKWNGIGGHVEAGESIKAAALRELAEEAGISTNALHLSGLVTIDSKQNPGIVMFVYALMNFDGQVIESIEGSLEWISPDELSKLNVVEDIPFLIQKVGETQHGGEPFYAHYSFDINDKLNIICD